MELLGRYEGALLGLACGDAVGTTVEFQPRGTFPRVRAMVGGGPFGLAPGQWTDDTSMALCLAQSLIERGGFDPDDQMRRYVRWWQEGYMSSTGECFDIGSTVAGSLRRYLETGDPIAGSTDPRTAGNGSLMRLAPVVLYFHQSADVVEFAAASSRTTHGAPEAVECCKVLATGIDRALLGVSKEQLLDMGDLSLTEPKVKAVARGGYIGKSSEDITGSGYCVASLEAALWCFERAASFEEAVLEAVNLGDDADTTAAIAGQLAGAYYGVDAIPDEWKATLHMRDEIQAIARFVSSDISAPGGHLVANNSHGDASMAALDPDYRLVAVPTRSELERTLRGPVFTRRVAGCVFERCDTR